MATAVLVDRDRELGRKVLTALTKADVPVSVSFWAFVPQLNEWQLFIATSLVDSEGPRFAYDQVLRVLHKEGIDDVPWRRIFLRSPKDRFFKSMERQVRAAQHETLIAVNDEIDGSFVEDAYIYGGFIDITKSGSEGQNGRATYYVTFAPYSTEKIIGSDHLREVLLSRFRIAQDIVDSAIRELSTSKRTFIPNIRLTAKDLKRLRSA
jgi:hypothetical protein